MFLQKVLRRSLPILFLERTQKGGVGIEARHHGNVFQRVLVFSIYAIQQPLGLHQAEVVDVVVEGRMKFLIDMVAEVLPVGAQMLG